MPKKNTCPSGKRKFPSKKSAFAALERILDEPYTLKHMYKPTGVRRCHACDGYHLTSNSAKQYAAGKQGRNLRCT
jgi:hypothetical protein